MAKSSAKTLTHPPESRVDWWLEVSLRFARERPLGAAGALIILLMISAALLANLIAPYDPLQTDYAAMLQAPSASHWFGTDSFGRDVLSRLIHGSRTALWVGFSSSFLGGTLGAVIGVVSAYFGGRIDLLV
jgi:peptide/nickel transport system permease protein